MKPSAQVVALCVAFGLVFFWTKIPSLHPYSLQLVAVLVLMYVLIKMQSKKRHSSSEAFVQLEFPCISAATLLLIWSSGGLHSPFLPVAFLLQSLAIFGLEASSVILLSFLLPSFLGFTAASEASTFQLGGRDLATLSFFPLFLPILLYAKGQHSALQRAKLEEDVLEHKEKSVLLFLTSFMKPKLHTLIEIQQFPDENSALIAKQTKVLLEETEAMIDDIRNS